MWFVPSRSDIKLPRSLKVVDVSYNKHLNLDQLLPALAKLPFCQSLDLEDCGGMDEFKASELDEVIVRSGLAVSPALNFLRMSPKDLPMLAAERARLGLPLVEVQQADGASILSDGAPYRPFLGMVLPDVKLPDISLGKCTLLPGEQIDCTPSNAWRTDISATVKDPWVDCEYA